MPESIAFATKIEIARDLIADALDAGMPCAWVLADALYGGDHSLRRMLEERQQPYVLAVRSNHYVSQRMASSRPIRRPSPRTFPPRLGARSPPARARRACGSTTGLRLPWIADEGFERWLLIRRSRKEPGKRAYYLAFAPEGTALAELAGAAGLRWTMEECFERAKDDLGLDHCEARSWHGWHRHMSLVMVAAAFLSRLSAQLRREAWGKPNKTSPAARIA